MALVKATPFDVRNYRVDLTTTPAVPRAGQPAWSKVHAKIDEAADGRIYFTCTLNGGSRAGDPK